MSDNAKPVLVFTTAYQPRASGAEIALAAVAEGLPQIDFHILTPRYYSSSAKLEKQGHITIYRLGWGVWLDKWLFPILGFFVGLGLLKRHPGALLHAWQASQAGGAAWLLRWWSGRPLLLTLQEGERLDRQVWWLRFFRWLIIRRADQAVAISQYLKKFIQTSAPNLPVTVIPNGVALEQFTHLSSYGEQAQLADQLGIRPGDKVLIHTGRLATKNGLINLLKAIPLVQEKLSQTTIKLLLVGSGPEGDKLASLAHELGIEQQIIWIKQVNQVQLVKYLQLAQVFIRPSLTEGLGNSFLEAMAAGVVIVGSGGGGIIDFLKDSETGLVCDPLNPADIAEKIYRLLDNSALKQKLAEAGQQLVLEKYGWEKIATQYAKLYQSIK